MQAEEAILKKMESNIDKLTSPAHHSKQNASTEQEKNQHGGSTA
jgi:hypothetical protein